MSLTHNISLLIAEASDLFSLINNLELDSENKNKIMQAAICDLSCIGKAISSADKNLSNEERLVLAIFLRFPFLERTDIDYIQSWKLLDEKEKIQVLKSVDQALEIALDTIPDRISTLDYILESGADQKNSGTAQRFSTHIFRFAQILALSHHGTKAEEKNELKKLAEILARQLNSYKYNDKKSKNPAKEKSAAIDINSISKNEEFDVETEILSLDQLIGLHSVKAEVRSLINLIRLQQARKNEGLKSVDVSLHAVFTGPPGTGKTTVARIYARILKALGILPEGHLVETDRAGLVAEFVGQTAPKTDKLIEKARGGVLFIDEAYSLISDSAQGDFGRESIEIILKRMEDLRSELVVIVAGYPDEMEGFLQSNPGLSSRFSRIINFPNYSAAELLQIFEKFALSSDYRLSEQAHSNLATICSRMLSVADRNFGNARAIRNLFEEAVRRQANRLSTAERLSRELLETLELQDFPAAGEI